MSGASASLLFNFHSCPPGGAHALCLALSVSLCCLSPSNADQTFFFPVRVCVFVVVCVFSPSLLLFSFRRLWLRGNS